MALAGQTKPTRQQWLLLGGAVLVYLALYLLCAQIRPYADDVWYWEKADTWRRDFWGLQREYYLAWSGRVVSSAAAFFLMHGRFWLWQLLNPLFLMALAWLCARIAHPQQTVPGAGFVLLLLFLLGPGVLDYAVFWATGSLYYLWPAVLALFALVPFFDLALRGEAGVTLLPLRLGAALLATACNEQLTACLLGFMVVVLGRQVLKTRALAGLWRHVGLLAAALPGTLVLFLSPGSQERYRQESYLYYLEHYIGFYEVPFWQKITAGITWMAGMVTGCLVVLLLGLYAVAWWRVYGRPAGGARPTAGGWVQGDAGPGTSARGLAGLRWPLLALGVLALGMVFPRPVDAMLAFAGPSRLGTLGAAGMVQAVLPYLFWGLFLAGLCGLLARCGWMYAVAFAAALASIMVLFFSPTIYASGERTLFFAGVIVCVLLRRLLPQRPCAPLWVGAACLAAVNTLRLVARLRLFF